jgi:hypothetical protein
MHKVLVGGLVTYALTGCASIPDVEYRYFPARATTSVSLTQSIDCNQDKTQLNITNTPTVLTTYSSDRSKKDFVLRTKDFRSNFADGDLKFEWFDDGRLKSVNQSSTGAGDNIIKAAMTFLAPVIGGAAVGPKIKECDDIAAWNSGKPVVIVYELTIEYAKGQPEHVLNFKVSANSRNTYAGMQKLLGPQLPVVEIKVGALQDNAVLVHALEEPAEVKSTIPLKLNKTAIAPIEILVSKSAFWRGKVVVPTTDTYTLPIPKPKLFGKQAFALTLNEAGGITAMGYTSLSGTAGALNALNSVSTTVSPGDSAKAAAIKAEADVIAQTQRLALCQAKPTDCK